MLIVVVVIGFRDAGERFEDISLPVGEAVARLRRGVQADEFADIIISAKVAVCAALAFVCAGATGMDGVEVDFRQGDRFGQIIKRQDGWRRSGAAWRDR